MSWIAALPAILVACAVVVGPGLIATAPLRMGVIARVALSGLVSACCAGAAGALFGALGLPFAPPQVLAVAVAVLLVSLAVRRRMPGLVVSGARQNPWALSAMWLLSAAIVAVVAFGGVPDPDRISQTYDNVFHLSAVSAILDGFSASPLTLRSLIETEAGGIAYYPAAWHQLVVLTAQLSGAPVPVAFNAAWIAVQALVWLPGVAWLSQVLLPRSAGAAGLVALPLGAAFGAFPYALLSWGTIYPTGFAHSLLPAAVAAVVLGIRGILAARAGARAGAVAMTVLAVVVAAGALAVAHPRVLPTWALIGAPFLIQVLARAFLRGWRRGGASRRRAVTWLAGGTSALLATAGVAFVYAVTRLGLFDEPLEDRLSGPQAQAVQGVADGVLQVLGMRAMTGEGGVVTAVAPALALAVILGVVAALRTRRTRWIVASFVLVAALFVLAAGSDSVLAKLLTGVWYKDRFRLEAALPVLGVPLATLGVLSLTRSLPGVFLRSLSERPHGLSARRWRVARSLGPRGPSESRRSEPSPRRNHPVSSRSSLARSTSGRRGRISSPCSSLARSTSGRRVRISSPCSSLARSTSGRRARIAAAVSVLVSLSAATGLVLSGTTSSVAAVFELPEEGARWQIVSQKQIDFMADVVAEEVPAGERVLGDPWDGSALTQLFAGREPVFPHVNGQWDHARRVLAWELQDIDEDPEVCRALDALRVRHVLYNPHEFGGGDPAGSHFPGPHAAVEAGLLTVAATDGESTLFRIEQCGPLADAP